MQFVWFDPVSLILWLSHLHQKILANLTCKPKPVWKKPQALYIVTLQTSEPQLDNADPTRQKTKHKPSKFKGLFMNSRAIPLTICEENPFVVAQEWLNLAEDSEVNDFNAMALATSDSDGLPDVRMVLLKGFDERGFVFYTNMTSAKGNEIKANPQAAINFHWKSLLRCMRARGPLVRVSEAESDAYFQSRSRGSRLASMASDQSSPLASREELLERIAKLEGQFGANDEDGEVLTRPDHWYGHRLVPLYFELWQDGQYRIHDSFVYRRKDVNAPWFVERLSP